MKNILIGNGVNIQHDNINYTNKNIIIRLLRELDNSDYPCEYITDEPLLLKKYIGILFLFAREMIDGLADKYTNCTAEVDALEDFKNRYKERKKSLRITDIGFEDYYLIHDLICHKSNTNNPEQFIIRECIKMAYYHSIYNHGKLNELYKDYSDCFKQYVQMHDCIFTTNYDSNLESLCGKEVHHIHGQFDKLSEVYNPYSLRNHLSDKPIADIPNEPEYIYLHSTALSTYCGDYKQFQLKQPYSANEGMEKLVKGYQEQEAIRRDVDSWSDSDNQLVINLAETVKVKIANPELCFQEDYSLKEFEGMAGTLNILGLSPYNDYHIFEMIEKSNISQCTYYYYAKEDCLRIKSLLPKLSTEGKLKFENVKDFWRAM